MTTRLTPEREAEIREDDARYSKSLSDGPELHRRELLNELDAVRQERDEGLRLNCDLKMRFCNHCLREVDDPIAAKLRTQELESQVASLRKKVQLAVEALEELSIMQVAAKTLKALREEPHEIR